ncbi:MAG TPA: hypothetical protein VM008_03845 [Phycisphaerae bacterium]|nr:hypothetical protein [Phycisphaerae bacterium]
MIERPLVFCPTCPTIIARHDLAVRFKQFFVSRRIAFKAEPFFTFERIRFPNATIPEIESLFDTLERRERHPELQIA